LNERAGTERRRVGAVAGAATVLGLIGVVVGLAFATSALEEPLAVGYDALADGDHGRIVWLMLATAAPIAPLVLLALAAQDRFGRWAAPLWLLVAGPALVVLVFMPGRHDDDSESAIDGATGYTGVGEVVQTSALACLVLVALTAAPLVAGERMRRRRPDGSRAERPRPLRMLAAVGGCVVVWVATGLVVIAVVGDTDGRGTWLPATDAELARGDDGLLGEFDPGLEPSYAEVVDCDEAREALTLDGAEVTELPGCRQALAVHATGRSGTGAQRHDDGELVALLIQVRWERDIDDLRSFLDDATLTAGAGLPAPPSDRNLVTEVDAAYSVLVAAEDSGDIPRPDSGAGAAPLTRALAYLTIDTATGWPVVPDPYRPEKSENDREESDVTAR
jgi:hypothetical protein